MVQRARAGSNEALSGLYERYAGDVFRLAYRFCGSRADAEDVLQTVFMGLPEALRTYDERGRFDAWLKKVTVRTALMRERARKARREEPLEQAGGLRSPMPGGEPILGELLRRAIEDLPAGCRRVFALKEIEGYSHEEIGALLGISPQASATRLHRARKRLRKTIEGG